MNFGGEGALRQHRSSVQEHDGEEEQPDGMWAAISRQEVLWQHARTPPHHSSFSKRRGSLQEHMHAVIHAFTCPSCGVCLQVKRPDGLAVKFKAFLSQNADTFKIDGDNVALMKKK